VRILFVCSECRLRSPTAAAVFSAYEGVQAICAGTNADAETPVSGDLIEWADVILVMEQSHRRKISGRFPDLLRGKKIGVLDIPDHFHFMDPLLVQILTERVPSYVGGLPRHSGTERSRTPP
jgi:predicted protein tyrosine phosphatase